MVFIKYLSVGVLSLASGFGAYAYLYHEKLKKVIDNLKIKVVGVSNFKVSFSKLSADIFFQIENTTEENISINTGGFIKADTLRVIEISTNKILAVSDLQIEKIELASNGFFDLPKVEVEIPLLDGAMIALTTLTSNSDDFLKRLRFELDLTGFSQTRTIHF